MIMCALALTRRPLRSTPRPRRPSISSVRTFGSITTPLPITHFLPGYRIPDGIRWNFQTVSSRTIVCPALLPPWKRITRSTCSASRSVTFPLPSSPHWAPMITMPAIGGSQSRGGLLPADGRRLAVAGRGFEARRRAQVLGDLDLAPLVGAEQRQRVPAHLDEAGDRALLDLLAQLLLGEVRGQDYRPLVLVAGVD